MIYRCLAWKFVLGNCQLNKALHTLRRKGLQGTVDLFLRCLMSSCLAGLRGRNRIDFCTIELAGENMCISALNKEESINNVLGGKVAILSQQIQNIAFT